MSVPRMYDAIADLAIRRHGTDVRSIRRAVFDLERQAAHSTSEEHKVGLEHFAKRLRARLDELETPAEAERGG